MLILLGFLAGRVGALARRLWGIVNINHVRHELHTLTRYSGDERALRVGVFHHTTPRHTNKVVDLKNE